MLDTKRITAFVTYAWDTEDFSNHILSFVAFLRRNGIDANCDRTFMENRTDPNFIQVMNDGLACDKVIVVLSKKYKEKANCENTGVNKEYSVIATQRSFEKSKNKFIFVSFQGTSQKDIEEIVPTMFLGNEILDLSKMDDNVVNRLFAKLRDKKTIELPPVADKMPYIKTKIYTGIGGKKHIFCFRVSADCSAVTYNDETKNSLRNWISARTEEVEIRIEDLHIKSLQEWINKKDDEIAEGKSLSQEDEMNYILVSQTIENEREKDKIVKTAIRTFIEKLSLEMSMYLLTVNDYLTVIEKIFMNFYFVNRKVGFANVEGWCMGDDKDFVFKAQIKDMNYRESTKMLHCRDARIEDFSPQDIIEGIVPAFCGYFAIGKIQNKEYAIEKKKNWLLSLQFGLA